MTSQLGWMAVVVLDVDGVLIGCDQRKLKKELRLSRTRQAR